MRLGDGITVCAPDLITGTVHVDAFTYYSDTACQVGAIVASGGEACDRDLIALQFVGGCPGIRFYHLAGAVERDLFTHDSTSFECRPVTDAERAGLQELGDEIDPTTLEHTAPGSAAAFGARPRAAARGFMR